MKWVSFSRSGFVHFHVKTPNPKPKSATTLGMNSKPRVFIGRASLASVVSFLSHTAIFFSVVENIIVVVMDSTRPPSPRPSCHCAMLNSIQKGSLRPWVQLIFAHCRPAKHPWGAKQRRSITSSVVASRHCFLLPFGTQALLIFFSGKCNDTHYVISALVLNLTHLTSGSTLEEGRSSLPPHLALQW